MGGVLFHILIQVYGAPTGVIGMLHDSHELDGVVSEIFDSRKDILSEFVVCSYPSL